MMKAHVRLSPPERKALKRKAGSRRLRVDETRRAILILGLAAGESYSALQRRLGCGRQYVARWKGRFLAERIAGLYSRHRGRKALRRTPALEGKILAATRVTPTDVDEKSAIQALDRLDPVLPLSPGRAERHGFEYFRHGTLSLYVALNTLTGEVLGKTTARHTSAEFVAFLEDLLATQPPKRQVHLIVDNLSAHKTKAVTAFLSAHPRLHIHYTPTYSS
ncbi:MAG: transposase [Chthoniobacterales bacterium]